MKLNKRNSKHKFLYFLIGMLSLIGIAACRPHIPIVIHHPSNATVTQLIPAIRWGGTCSSIAQHPRDENTTIVAAAGGLYKTSNAAGHWNQLPGFPVGVYPIDVKYCPYNPMIVVATGYYDGSVRNRGGIWISNDSGHTWQQPATASPAWDASSRTRERLAAYGIAFDPDTPKIYVATDYGLAISKDFGRTWGHIKIDLSIPLDGRGTQDGLMAVFPTGHGRIIVSGNADIYYSLDKGAHWNKSNNHLGAYFTAKNTFASAPGNRNLVFFTDVTSNLWYSVNNGLDWTQIPVTPTGNIPPFVRVAGNANNMTVYYGNGVNVYKGSFTRSGSTLAQNGMWNMLSFPHTDYSDLCFNLDSTQVKYIVGDPGPTRPTGSPDNYSICGTPVNGFNALKTYDLAGQVITGSQPHTDLYFSTWDNFLWASNDMGATWPWGQHLEAEGYWIVPGKPMVENHNDSTVLVRSCGACYVQQATPHWTSGQAWRNPTGQTYLAMPAYIAKRTYVETGVRCDAMNNPIDDTTILNFTRDYGRTWAPALKTRAYMWFNPVVQGSDSLRVMYYPAYFNASSYRNGFYKITFDIYGNIVSADQVHSDSLRSHAFTLNYIVMAVDPFNTEHLIAADREAKCMKVSYDGGRSWTRDNNLTRLICDLDKYSFWLNDEVSAVTTIAFNPFWRNHILVGTRYNGIMMSNDGGANWFKIDGTEKIMAISRIFIDASGSIFASSIGRGVWKVDYRYQIPPIPHIQDYGPWVIDPETHVRMRLADLRNPEYCPACNIIFAKDGYFTDINVVKGQLQSLSISGGSTQMIDYKYNAYKVPVPVNIGMKPEMMQNQAFYKDMVANNLKIKGIIVEGNTLKKLIMYNEDNIMLFEKDKLLKDDYQGPVLHVAAENGSGGAETVTIGNNEIMKLMGGGFLSKNQGSAEIVLLIDGKQSTEGIKADGNGIFNANIKVSLNEGYHTIEAILATDKSIRATAKVYSKPMD